MGLRVRYFGQLQEITGKKEESLTGVFGTIGNLRAHLIRCYPGLEKIHFKIAQDNTIYIDSSEVNGTLIDLLPPFSGG